MIEQLQTFATALAALLSGVAVGATYVAARAVPQEAFEHMDYTRADRHVRYVLNSCSTAIAGMLLAVTALSILGGAFGAATLGALAAFGFFSNRWTLSRRKPRTAPPGTKRKLKSQRVVAFSLSILFGGVALVAGVLAALGV